LSFYPNSAESILKAVEKYIQIRDAHKYLTTNK